MRRIDQHGGTLTRIVYRARRTHRHMLGLAAGAAGAAMGLPETGGGSMIAIGIGANSRAHKDDFADVIAAIRGEIKGGDIVATFGDAVFATFVKAAATAASRSPTEPLKLEALRDRSDDCLTRSERTLERFGVASVAEAAALAAAGPGSHLVVPRRIIGNVTVAAARSAEGLE